MAKNRGKIRQIRLIWTPKARRRPLYRQFLNHMHVI